MKTMKKLLPILFCVVMVVTIALTAYAAGGETNVYMTVDKTEVKPGDTITVTLSCNNMKVTSFTAGIRYDKTQLDITSIVSDDPEYPEDFGLYQKSKGSSTWVPATAMSTIQQAKANGQVGFGYAGTTDKEYVGSVLFTVTFVVKEGVTDSITIGAYEDTAGTDAFQNKDEDGNNILNETKTVTIAPACDHVGKTYTYEAINATTHKVICECGETVKEAENHDYVTDKDGYCKYCPQKCYHDNELVTKTDLGWTYNNNNTHTSWSVCDCGDRIQGSTWECSDADNDGDHTCDTCSNTTALNNHTGGTATCTDKAKCAECGEEYGEALGHGHTLGFRYSNNSDNTHTVVCLDCNKTTEENVTCSIKYEPAKEPANCKETGHGEYWYCEYCEAYFANEEGSNQLNPAWIFYTGDHVRPESAADCATVECELCGEDIYGEGEHNTGVPACQTGTCSKCNEIITGYGCANYDTPACMDGVCYYCGGFVAGLGHENGAWAPCKEGECSYGCGLKYPATAEHIDDDGDGYCDTCWDHLRHNVDPCVGGECTICWTYVAGIGHESDAEAPCQDGICTRCNEPVAATENHEYFYACDPYCCKCYELTNPEATHSITHVEAKPGTDCQTYDGHLEYWTCSHCGGVWTDENLMRQTNMMSIKVNGEHQYEYDCSKNCKVCNEETRPNADHAYEYVCSKNCKHCGEETRPNADHDFNGTVPYTCVCGAKFTGWDGDCYIKEAEVQKTGWTEIEGAWYYLNPVTGIRAEGLTRVPYPTVIINGVKYGPDQDAMEYDPNFIDAEEAWFYFGSDGKFLQTANGYFNHGDEMCASKLVNGMLAWHPGLIVDANGDYSYFIGDLVNGGNICAEGDTYITKTNGIPGFVAGDIYHFTYGALSGYNGIVDGKYYENSRLMIGNGLTKIGDKYIYVRSNGKVVVNADYYVPANDLGVAAGMYHFDENGYLVNPNPSSINGVVDGYYYIDGKIAYGAGLIKDENGNIYYVRSNGQVATGKYYITNTNGMEGFSFGDKLYFGEDGKMEAIKDGIIDGYYYEKNRIQYAAGLIEWNGDIYYVRSNGQVATGAYYVTNVNDMEGYKAGDLLVFGEDGKLTEN